MLPDNSTVFRPRFELAVVLPRLIPLMAFAALFVALALTLLVTIAFGSHHEPFSDVGEVPGWAIYAGLVALGAVFGPPLAARGVRRAYESSQCLLGEEAVEVRRDWVFVSRQAVPYRKIVEVAWSAGPLQRRAGLGTVRLLTASDADGGSGLRLADLPEPEKAYRELSRRVEAAQKRS